ncbi:MAG: hypothetical protein HDKAJFGB_01339 [Anaerolineae bacterium]|nr:hypothetical protein [Anaerolineae bacterium]
MDTLHLPRPDFWRSLRRNETEKIGLVLYTHTPLSSRSSEYYFEIIRGAATTSESMGYNLVLYLTVGNQTDRLMNVCRSHEVDCLILMLGSGELDTPISLLLKEKVPFIVLNKHPRHLNVSYIVSDHEIGKRFLNQVKQGGGTRDKKSNETHNVKKDSSSNSDPKEKSMFQFTRILPVIGLLIIFAVGIGSSDLLPEADWVVNSVRDLDIDLMRRLVLENKRLKTIRTP